MTAFLAGGNSWPASHFSSLTTNAGSMVIEIIFLSRATGCMLVMYISRMQVSIHDTHDLTTPVHDIFSRA